MNLAERSLGDRVDQERQREFDERRHESLAGLWDLIHCGFPDRSA
jgi:hypothetical protein